MSKLETVINKKTHIQDIDYRIFSGTKWNKRRMKETQMEKEEEESERKGRGKSTYRALEARLEAKRYMIVMGGRNGRDYKKRETETASGRSGAFKRK
jgi:hypothetical protein